MAGGLKTRIILAFACVTAAQCQEFEVISIKPNNSGSNSTSSSTNNDRYTTNNISLRFLITRAYNVKDYQVKGPDWITSDRFDIAAKLPSEIPKDKFQRNQLIATMLQKMLADRFKLVFHRAQKLSPVYGLIATKEGIKFKQATDTGSSGQSTHNTHYQGTNVSMPQFAEFLSGQMDFPVIDMSGLKSSYDLTLDWSTDPQTAGDPIPEAIKTQLGLKLETRKAPIELLVVDRAIRVPTEN